MISHSPLKLKLVRFDNGERFPMLLNRGSGMPLFKPTVYAVSMIRATNVASATISRNLKAIMHLYAWAEISGFDLEKRFLMGEFLNLNEIDSLAAALGNRFDHYCKTNSADKNELHIRDQRNVRSLEKYRKQSKDNNCSVAAATKAVRLLYNRNYLDWLAQYYLRKNLRTSERYPVLDGDRRFMADAIDERVPTVGNNSFFGAREGLPLETQKRLQEVINPASRENPWENKDARARNYLFVLMCLMLGVRRGELLLTRIVDLNFQENKLLVRRIPDDKDDFRLNEPNAKSLDRELSLDGVLPQLIHEYIVTVRNKPLRARKHAFLFVAIHSGEPLSTSSVTKIFKTLRNKVPDLPDDLTTHVLRHTWNERFSELMDEKKVPEEDEKKLRKYQQGWKGEHSAEAYTRRHVRIKANEASIELQRKIKSTTTPQAAGYTTLREKKDGEEDVPF